MLLALVLLVAQGVPDGQAVPVPQPALTSEQLVVASSNRLPAAPSSFIKREAVSTSAAPPSEAAMIVPVGQTTTRRKLEAPSKRAWVGLAIALHGSAAFDAWTTRQRLATGRYHETNPLLKPFANSNSLYAVTQVTPTALDWVGNRLRKSDHRWARRLWWLPQATQTATHLTCGAMNLTK